MRIALLADIHGNLVALDAALTDLAERAVDQIVCLGDLAMSGPQPHACVARIAALGCPTVMGNCDEFVLRVRREGRAPDLMRTYARRGAWVAEIDIWSAEALHAEDEAYLAALPMTVSISLAPDVTLLCAHGSPQSFNHRLLPETPEETVVALIGPTEATALASGHTHVPMVRRVGPLTIVNPGSIGLPMEVASDGAITNPADYAEYGVVEWTSDGLIWEPHRIALDAKAVRAAAWDSGMPFADRWRGDWSRP